MTPEDTSTSPVLFLDFDGVLNSDRWRNDHEGRARAAFPPFDPSAVALLNGILRESGCLVVISSTWRLLAPVLVLRTHLHDSGLGLYTRIIGKTPILLLGSARREVDRGLEIQAWRETYSHTGPFCILDDDDDMAHLCPWLVQTTFEEGLTAEAAARCVEMLQGSDGGAAMMASGEVDDLGVGAFIEI